MTDFYWVKFTLPSDKKMSVSEYADGMKDVLLGIQSLNNKILSSIRNDVEVISYVEDFQKGSLKLKIRDYFKNISDKDIEKFSQKPLNVTLNVSLKKIRNFVLNHLDETEKIEDNEQRKNVLSELIQENFKKLKEKIPSDDLITVPGVISDDDMDNLLNALSQISGGARRSGGNVEISENEKDYQKINRTFDYLPPTTKENVNIDQKTVITAWIQAYSPVYDEESNKWKFSVKIDGQTKAISMDISQTNIAQLVMHRGGVHINDSFKVKFEISHPPGKRKTYKILELIKFHPAEKSRNLFD